MADLFTPHVQLEEEERERARARKGRDRCLAALPNNRATAAAVTLGATYLGLRLSLAAFHRLRRRFLRQLLFDLVPALEAAGCTFWVDFGSLLGIHRDGDLILHDNDIDMAVLNPDWPTLLEKLKPLLEPKYRVKVVTPENPESTWLRVYCPLGMADLFNAHDRGGDEIFVDCGHGSTMHLDRNLVLPPGKMEWRGHVLPCPANVEGTLRRRYGDTWATPAYMDKGADTVEGSKPYARLFRALARAGLRI